MFLEGNTLCSFDLKTKEKKHLVSDRTGFSVFDTNHKRNQLVVAEYGLDPKIFHYNRNLELQYVYEGEESLEFKFWRFLIFSGF